MTMDPTTIAFLIFFAWIILGIIGDKIRQSIFNEASDFADFLLGPITLILSGIECLIIKYQNREYQNNKKDENKKKSLTKYEIRAIERINKLLEI